MLPSAVVIKPAEIELLDEFQPYLAKEAVLVVLVVVKDSDLQHLVHIADIPGRLTHSLREHFDSTYNVSYKRFNLQGESAIPIGIQSLRFSRSSKR